jgi:hypothetical protein
VFDQAVKEGATNPALKNLKRRAAVQFRHPATGLIRKPAKMVAAAEIESAASAV